MDNTQRTNPERITALEVEVRYLKETVNDLLEVTKAQNAKLDSLLELKAKGMGAVWLASAIIGSAVYLLVSWLKGNV